MFCIQNMMNISSYVMINYGVEPYNYIKFNGVTISNANPKIGEILTISVDVEGGEYNITNVSGVVNIEKYNYEAGGYYSTMNVEYKYNNLCKKNEY